MEEKQTKDNQPGTDSNSSGDDSSVRRPAVEEPAQNHTGLPYSAHITSVCEALNAQGGRATSPFEEVMLEKRRETNRLSARNRRKRRGVEIKHLLEEQRRLSLESKQLAAEKAELQAELHHEVSMTSSFADNTSATHFQGPAPQISPVAQLLRNQLQHQMQHTVLIPNIAPVTNPSTALLANLALTSAWFNTTSLEAQIRNQNVARSFVSPTPNNIPLVPSLDLLELLSQLQANQAAVASLPSIHTSWIGPQILTATPDSAAVGASLLSATASLENRHETTRFCSDEELARIVSLRPSAEQKPPTREPDAKHPK